MGPWGHSLAALPQQLVNVIVNGEMKGMRASFTGFSLDLFLSDLGPSWLRNGESVFFFSFIPLPSALSTFLFKLFALPSGLFSPSFFLSGYALQSRDGPRPPLNQAEPGIERTFWQAAPLTGERQKLQR